MLLRLQISFLAIAARDENVNDGRSEHEQGKEPEISRMFHRNSVAAQEGNDEQVKKRDELVPGENHQKPKRHDRALHLVRRLRVGELQSGDRNHRFARRQDDVGQHLPPDRRCFAAINQNLDPPDHGEGKSGEKEAYADFAQRGEREEAANERIEAVVEQRNESEDEQPVNHVHLRSEQTPISEKPQVHLLRLEGPFSSGALIPQSPEDDDKHVNDRQATERAQSFLARELLEELRSPRRDMNEFFAAQPKNYRRDKHQNTRQTEGVMRSPFGIVEQNWAEVDRESGAGIDGEIEPTENFREQMLVRFAKLVANVG